MSKPSPKKTPRPKTGGRPLGQPNVATREFRDTVRKVLDSNHEKVGVWLTYVAEGDGKTVRPDPARALDLLSKLAEYAAPKLSRTEHVGRGGGPISHVTATMTPAEAAEAYAATVRNAES